MTSRSRTPGSLRLTIRLIQRVREHRFVLAAALASMFVAGLAETAPIGLATIFVKQVLMREEGHEPSMLGQKAEAFGAMLVESVGAEVSDPRQESLVGIVVLVLMVGVLTAGATFANTFFGRWIAALVVADLRRSMMRKVVDLPVSFFARRKHGDLVSRFSSDATMTHRAINVFLLILVLQPIILVFAMGWAVWINWRLAAVSFVAFPPLALIIAALGHRIRKRSRRSLSILGDSLEAMSQALSGQRVLKSFRAEDAQVARFDLVNANWLRRQASLFRAKALSRSVMDLVFTFTVAVVLALGGWLVITETWGLDVTAFAGFIVALATIYRPVRRLGQAYNDWEESMASAHRIYEVLDAPGEPADAPDAQDIGPIRQGIRLENLDFSYADDADHPTPVLRDVSFEIPAGQTVALVGPSGSGKSTIADLLLRLHAPQRGRILVDGLAASAIRRDSFLDQVAVVSQHPFLFNTTVRENIAYGRPGATDEEIYEAARAAQIHELILTLPQGYETVVGERGETLSGGQRQRITIARAILKQASFLVLDEATSSLDTESEKAVQAALEHLLEGRTALVIAHRLSTIESADRVVVLEDGRVVEDGPHAALRASDGPFARLYRAQFGSA